MSRGDGGGGGDKEVKVTLDGSSINEEDAWTGAKNPQTFLSSSSLTMVTVRATLNCESLVMHKGTN